MLAVKLAASRVPWESAQNRRRSLVERVEGSSGTLRFPVNWSHQDVNALRFTGRRPRPAPLPTDAGAEAPRSRGRRPPPILTARGRWSQARTRHTPIDFLTALHEMEDHMKWRTSVALLIRGKSLVRLRGLAAEVQEQSQLIYDMVKA